MYRRIPYQYMHHRHNPRKRRPISASSGFTRPHRFSVQPDSDFNNWVGKILITYPNKPKNSLNKNYILETDISGIYIHRIIWAKQLESGILWITRLDTNYQPARINLVVDHQTNKILQVLRF